MSAEEYLGQLPAEYDEVSATASSTLHGAITNVQSYIERLEAIKATLGRREPTSVAAAELLGDVKTGSASTSASFKEWVNNVNKAGKDVEKVRGPAVNTRASADLRIPALRCCAGGQLRQAGGKLWSRRWRRQPHDPCRVIC